MSNVIGVTGIDGYTPVYQPDGKWAMWSIKEIYNGGVGQNKYIPKVDDYVIEPETGLTYIVTNLDIVTFIPNLAPINLQQNDIGDSILSSTNDNYRVYYDKSVTPHTLSVDGLLRVYSSTATVARIYKGHFIDPTQIISRKYDNNGNFIGDAVSLQLVAFNSHDNYSIKNIPACNTTFNLNNGEACVVVVFDSSGKVVSKINCIIEETTYVAQAYAEQKYITQIFLKSPFINASQQNEIDYPMNLPLTSFNPIGVVQYNDSSQVEYPIDGDKFKIFGLDQFMSTIIGHRVPLVLSYRMDASEAALASVDSVNYYVTRPYSLVVSNANTSYNVKIFTYPVWVDALNGYRLKSYLMNLDRNILIDITNLITITDNSPSFNPLAYGITQRITFSVELSTVSGIYNHYVHLQTVDIVLRGPASDYNLTNIWEVSNQIPATMPFYGTGLKASIDSVTHTKIRIDNNIATLQEFLNKVYKTTNPLTNPTTEAAPIIPTHIEVKAGSQSLTVPIEQYTDEFIFQSAIAMYTNIDVIFLKQSINGYLKLAIANLTVR